MEAQISSLTWWTEIFYVQILGKVAKAILSEEKKMLELVYFKQARKKKKKKKKKRKENVSLFPRNQG